MKSVNKLTVTYHNRNVGTLSMTPDNRLCAFQHDKKWLVNGFSISPINHHETGKDLVVEGVEILEEIAQKYPTLRKQQLNMKAVN